MFFDHLNDFSSSTNRRISSLAKADMPYEEKRPSFFNLNLSSYSSFTSCPIFSSVRTHSFLINFLKPCRSVVNNRKRRSKSKLNLASESIYSKMEAYFIILTSLLSSAHFEFAVYFLCHLLLWFIIGCLFG